MKNPVKTEVRNWLRPALMSALVHFALIGWLVCSIGFMPVVPPAPQVIEVDILEMEPEPVADVVSEAVPSQTIPRAVPDPAPYVAPATVDREMAVADMPEPPPLTDTVEEITVLPAPARSRKDTAPPLALAPAESLAPVPETRRGEAVPLGLSKPPYPRDARKLGQEGTVTVWVKVGRDGRAAGCTIAESSGFPSLDQAARGAVLAAHYRPAHIGGIPCDGDINLRFRFRLED